MTDCNNYNQSKAFSLYSKLFFFYIENVYSSIIDQHHALSYITLFLIRWLLHVSASMCHLQGAYHVLVSYLKAEIFMLFV
jgi:hypothetical protein